MRNCSVSVVDMAAFEWMTYGSHHTNFICPLAFQMFAPRVAVAIALHVYESFSIIFIRVVSAI